MNNPNYNWRDTIKFQFDRNFIRPKAFEIKKWFIEKVLINGDDVEGVHLSFVTNSVYLKMKTPELCSSVVDRCGGKIKFLHSDGTVSEVTVSYAGFGIRTLRVFELPFEIPAEEINIALRPYGRIISNIAEKWDETYMFPVLNGVRQVKIELQKHIPSFINICGFRALIIYDGQPKTCALCNSTEHVRSECPRRRVPQLPLDDPIGPGPVVSMKLTYAAAADISGPSESVPQNRGETSTVQAIDTVTEGSVSCATDDLPNTPASNESASTGMGDEDYSANVPSSEVLESVHKTPEMDTPKTLHALSERHDTVASPPEMTAAGPSVTGKGPQDATVDVNLTVGPLAEHNLKETENQHLLTLGKGKKFTDSEADVNTVSHEHTGAKRSSVRRQEQIRTDRSPVTSPERSQSSPSAGSPKKSSKASKKRRMAQKAAESLAPALREKLRNIREVERMNEKYPAKKIEIGSEEESSLTDVDDSCRSTRMKIDDPHADGGIVTRSGRHVSVRRLDWADDEENQSRRDMEMDEPNGTKI